MLLVFAACCRRRAGTDQVEQGLRSPERVADPQGNAENGRLKGVQLLVRGGTGGTEVAGGPSSVLQCVERLSTEAVDSMTVERTVPILVLHHVSGSERRLTVSATDVRAAG